VTPIDWVNLIGAAAGLGLAALGGSKAKKVLAARKLKREALKAMK